MRVQTIRIPDELAERIERLAEITYRSKTSFYREAIERYLDDMEDLEISLERIRDPDTDWMSHDEVKRELDLD